MRNGLGWSSIGVAVTAFCGAAIASFAIVQFVWLHFERPLVPESASPTRAPVAERPTSTDLIGWVEEVEIIERWIRVSSGFLGLHSTKIAITPDTVIVVDEKQGGVRDIRQGARVSVVYEERDAHHIARIVKVIRRK
jgi:hypothetical protein